MGWGRRWRGWKREEICSLIKKASVGSLGGQLLRSKEVDWGHNSDEKQESIYSYLRAREAERKLISVPTAHCLHGAQIWVSQHFSVTLTPWSQLLTDKAILSLLLCSRETWPCLPKVSLKVCGQTLLIILWYICNLQLWGIITSIWFRGTRGPCWLIQYQCVHFFFSFCHVTQPRWGNGRNSDRHYFEWLQNHCRWWLQPWN